MGESPQSLAPAVQVVDPEFSPKRIAITKRILNRVWGQTTSVERMNAAGRYLSHRVPGLDLSKLSNHLRLHARLEYFEDTTENESVLRGHFPTLVARVVDLSGKPITLHRTYLTAAGRKAPFEDAKKQMKGIRKLAGEGIPLTDEVQSRTLGLTEGIETGLAVATGYRYSINVWAMLNCRNLSLSVVPKDRFDKVIIFADHDSFKPNLGYRPGEHYARILEARLKAEGFEVEVKIPKEEGTDFADVWLQSVDARQRVNAEVLPVSTAVLKQAKRYDFVHHNA
jgi:putative DNA primase/helicase